MCRVHLIELAARQTYNKNPVVGHISEMVQETLSIQRNYQDMCDQHII